MQAWRPALAQTGIGGRVVTLDFPAAIRTGDEEEIRLTLDVDNISGQAAGQIDPGQSVLAEASLELPGMEFHPQNTVSEPLLPGQKATFYWKIRTQRDGNYKGTVWLHLRFIPKDGSTGVRKALMAQPIEIEAGSLFGLRAGLARWLGAGGLLLGLGLSLPYFQTTWRRIRRRS